MLRKLGLAVSGTIVLATGVVRAQSVIVPDGTLGAESSQVIQNYVGRPIEVIAGGAQRGQNLFHSFSQFNVSVGRGAYFAIPNDVIRNVLSRVTGGSRSDILGTLGTFRPNDGRVRVPGVNLFLINPNGIVFGKNASLDIGGSFFATTANAIQLGDAGLFSASQPTSSNLLNVNPSAFLFNAIVAQNLPEIVVRSQATETVLGDQTFGLQVPNGNNLLLLGGNVAIDGGQLNARKGRVEIGAVRGIGSVGLNTNGSLSVPNEMKRADVVFTQQGWASVSLDNAGDIGITARNIDLLEGSALYAGILSGRGSPTSQAGNITLSATDMIRVIQSGIKNAVGQGSTGNGGNIQINARSLLIDGGQMPTVLNNGDLVVGAIVYSATSGTGSGGNVTINAQDRVILDRGGSILSSTTSAGDTGNIVINTGSLTGTNLSRVSIFTTGQGNAGDVTVNVQNRVFFSGGIEDNVGSGITNQVLQNGSGNSGGINITSGSLILEDNAIFSANTFSKGNSGNIQINTRNEIRLETSSSIFSTVTQAAEGKGGNINLTAGSLALLSGSQLDASTLGKGNSGDIVVNIRDTILVDGINPKIPDRSSTLFTEVFTGAEGNGGNIYISAGSLLVTNGGQLDAKTRGQGNAGNIFITARDHVLFDGSSSEGKSTRALSSVDRGAEGNGGNIEIVTGTLTVSNGAQLLANTIGQGDGGSIIIKARDGVFFGGQRTVGRQTFPSAVFTSVNSDGVGNAGNVEITAGSLTVIDNAGLYSETLGQGNAGNVFINTRDFVTVQDQSEISARTSSDFQGGDVNITTNKLQVNNGTITVSSSGSGDTGNILVNAQMVQLDDKAKIIAEAASGNGGDIVFNVADLLVLRRGSTISTTAGTAQAGGNGGNITINGGFLIAIPKENSDITANAFSGTGGNITLSSPGIFGLKFRPKLTEFSDITASSDFGNSGTIQLNAPDNAVIQNGLTEFPQTLTDTTPLLANSCIVRSRKQNGRFVITGSGGLPLRPGDAPLSSFPTGEVRGVRGEEGQGRQGEQGESYSIQNPPPETQQVPDRPWKIGDPIVEPQGVYRLANGELVMSRECP